MTTDEPQAALTAPTPMDLLRVATEKGFNPDQLEKLVRLQEQWEANEARKAFAEAMAACQSEMPTILTDAANPQTRSRYARLETINLLVKPVYVRNGFALAFGTADSFLPGHYRVTCDVIHRAGHRERYQIDMPADGIGPKGNPIGGMNGPQSAGSTLAYGRRYLTAMVFNLTVADEDNDAVGSGGITREQADELRKLIADAGRDEAKFLLWARVDDLAKITLRQFNEAKRMLKGNGQKGGGR